MNQNNRIETIRRILVDRGACYDMGDTACFFTNESEAVRVAQLICGTCPADARSACLEYALTTGVEYGVWGGIFFWGGRTYYRKRPPGRPASEEAALPVDASKEDLWELVHRLSPAERIA